MRSRTIRRALCEFGLWWVAGTGLWVALLSAWSGFDALVGAGCAVPCAAVGTGARRVLGRPDWRASAGFWRPAARVPGSVLTDTLRALRLVIHPTAARAAGFRSVRLSAEFTGVGRHAGPEAFTTLVLSTSPGAYVIDVADGDRTGVDRPGAGQCDPDGARTVMVHAIGPPTGPESALRRGRPTCATHDRGEAER